MDPFSLTLPRILFVEMLQGARLCFTAALPAAQQDRDGDTSSVLCPSHPHHRPQQPSQEQQCQTASSKRQRDGRVCPAGPQGSCTP